MLISFSVSNFRSIGEEQTLNMIASARITDHADHLIDVGATGKKVVRAAVMYGANAAGKSNIVRAMKFAQNMIERSSRKFATAPPRFRFAESFRSKPTSIEFRFLTLNHVFTYGFDAGADGIEQEWLTVLSDVEDHVIFERDKSGKTKPGRRLSGLFPDDNKIEDLLAALSFLPLATNQLLLNRVATLPSGALGKTLKAITHWFTKQLLILLPDHQSDDLLDRLYEDTAFRKLSECFLEAVGTGVGGLDFETEEVEIDVTHGDISSIKLPARFRNPAHLRDVKPKPDDPARGIRRQLLAIHPSAHKSATLPFSEESDGTIKLLHLMPVLAPSPKERKVVVIDELDRSLHPLLCWEFIRLFSETSPGAHKQLIVTTHEAHLLNQELLRRDEYWFVEKDKRQQTQLASLSEYAVRNDLKIEKGYLQGRFGAIPFIGSMAEIERMLNEGVAEKEALCPDASDL